jgi:hypothetical protein
MWNALRSVAEAFLAHDPTLAHAILSVSGPYGILSHIFRRVR